MLKELSKPSQSSTLDIIVDSTKNEHNYDEETEYKARIIFANPTAEKGEKAQSKHWEN